MKKATLILCFTIVFSSIFYGQSKIVVPDIKTFLHQSLENHHNLGNSINNCIYHSRNANTNPQFLDSLIEFREDNLYKYEYLYNQMNMLESELTYITFDSTRVPYLKGEYAYLNDTLIEDIRYSGMDYTTMEWKEIIKYEYIYNNLVLESQTIFEVNEITELWVPEWRILYSFDNLGLYDETIGQDYDTINQVWVNDVLFSYVFNDNSEIIEFTEKEWDDQISAWVNAEKQISTYNAEGYKTEFIRYYYEQSSWQEGYKIEFTQDNEGGLIKEHRYSWDESLGQWRNSSKLEITRDSFGNIINIDDYHWQTDTQEWTHTFRTSRTYNSSYVYNDLVLPWHGWVFSNLYSNSIIPFHYYNFQIIEHNFAHMWLTFEREKWYESSNSWEILNYSTNYYSDHITVIPEGGFDDIINVYPNPASNQIVIDTKNNSEPFDFILFDNKGSIKLSKKNVDNVINLQNISSGIYFYVISIGANEYRGKIIISK